VARDTERLGVARDTANNAVLADGKRFLIEEKDRSNGATTIGVEEHVWRHIRRGDNFEAGNSRTRSTATRWSDPWAGSRVLRNAAMESFCLLLQKNVLEPPLLGHPRPASDRHRDLDRADLARTPTAARSPPVGPHRVRDHLDHASHSSCVTQHVTRTR
jgi:hypothetical protein